MVQEQQDSALLIEFLYEPDCPSHERALARLRDVMAEEACVGEVVIEAVLNRDQAAARKFLGSPTIRVNGVDVEPGSQARSDYGLTCRAYIRSDGRISPLPPQELIRDALNRAAPEVSD